PSSWQKKIWRARPSWFRTDITFATVCNCAARGLLAGNWVVIFAFARRPVIVLAYVLARVRIELPDCTSCKPLSNFNSCCTPAAPADELLVMFSVAMPLPAVDPEYGGGTVAGDVCCPVQKMPQLEAGLIGVREQRRRNGGAVVIGEDRAIGWLHQHADVGQHGCLACFIEALYLRQAGVQAVGIAAVSDGQQRGLRKREVDAVLGVEAVVLLRRADRDDGVVAIVAASKEHTHQCLVAGAGAGEGVDLTELGERSHGAEGGYGLQRIFEKITS